ncbi:hypothetical protein TNCV_1545911 [Trichonephila clavipes]|nr:hypothetical protein TNCV_1545911 [Trichonephila clavipes]
MTLVDSRGNPTNLEVKVLVIIAGSIVDAEVINLNTDSIIPAADRVVQRNGAFRGQNGQNRISSLRMTPVDLPYVPILLNETIITVLWDTESGKIIYIRRGVPQILFISTTSKDKRQSSDGPNSPVLSLRSG